MLTLPRSAGRSRSPFWSAPLLALALAAAGCEADRLDGRTDTGGGGTGGSGGATAGTQPEAAIDEGGPLGAHIDAGGHLQIAVRSLRAERVEVWLYGAPTGEAERHVAALEPREEGYFRGVVPADVLAKVGLTGTLYYGLRAWGPGWAWDPAWTPGSSCATTG